jgi:polyisoprenoid-binding protein YceI
LLATLIDASNIKFIGDLTLKEEIKPATMLVTFNDGADNLLSGHVNIGFFAAGSFELSEYGIENYTLIVGDAIKLEIDMEFQKKDPKEVT